MTQVGDFVHTHGPAYGDGNGALDGSILELQFSNQPEGSPLRGVVAADCGSIAWDSGATWTVEAPLDIAWGPVSPVGVEVGGVEQLRADGPFFLIGGTVAYNVGGYSMYVLRSDAGPAGPFAPVVGGFRLSGTSSGRCCITALAAFAKDYDSGAVLVSQYIVTSTATGGRRPSLVGGGDVWLLPLRLPAEDADGRLVCEFFSGANATLSRDPGPLALYMPVHGVHTSQHSHPLTAICVAPCPQQ